jgi:hypothetical protein
LAAFSKSHARPLRAAPLQCSVQAQLQWSSAQERLKGTTATLELRPGPVAPGFRPEPGAEGSRRSVLTARRDGKGKDLTGEPGVGHEAGSCFERCVACANRRQLLWLLSRLGAPPCGAALTVTVISQARESDPAVVACAAALENLCAITRHVVAGCAWHGDSRARQRSSGGCTGEGRKS